MAVGIINLIVVVSRVCVDVLGWINYVLVVGICYNVTMSVEVLVLL